MTPPHVWMTSTYLRLGWYSIYAVFPGEMRESRRRAAVEKRGWEGPRRRIFFISLSWVAESGGFLGVVAVAVVGVAVVSGATADPSPKRGARDDKAGAAESGGFFRVVGVAVV